MALIAAKSFEKKFRDGSMDLVDRINTLKAKGRSTRAAQEALNESLHILKDMKSYSDGWIEKNIPEAYRQGWDQAFKSSLYATPSDIGGAYTERAFAKMHREAIESIAYNMRNNVDLALAQVGRQIADEFRQVGMEEALRRQFTGATIRESTQNMVGQLKGMGLTQFTDKVGRKWTLDNYCTMVARTTTREATTQGTLLRARRLGHKHIGMSEHYPTCEQCAPLQGRVYTTDESDKQYPLWSDDYCPVHPNCLHTIYVYVKQYDKNAGDTLKKSNRSFKDTRSPAEKAAYNSLQAANQKASSLRNQYARYLERLGRDKVGSLRNFARSKAANSARYKELQAAYRKAKPKPTPKPQPKTPPGEKTIKTLTDQFELGIEDIQFDSSAVFSAAIKNKQVGNFVYRLEQMPTNMKQLADLRISKLKATNFKAKNGQAYYSPKDKRIFMDLRGALEFEKEYGLGDYKVFQHELGHFIDDVGRTTGASLSMTPKYKTAMLDDLESFLRRFDNSATPGSWSKPANRKAASEYIRRLDDNTQGSVSDIVGGYTDNKVVGKYQHSVAYWNSTNQTNELASELFAHLWEASSDSKLWKSMQEVFPQTTKVFIEIIDGVVKYYTK